MAYASTLSVSVYDVQTQQIEAIFTYEDVGIACIDWEQSKGTILAIGLLNKKVVIWDWETQEI